MQVRIDPYIAFMLLRDGCFHVCNFYELIFISHPAYKIAGTSDGLESLCDVMVRH